MHCNWRVSVLAKNLALAGFLFCLALLIYKCKNPKIATDYYVIQPVATHENGNGFVGSATCIQCHKNIYDSHINTAHFKTSARADSLSIKGSFKEGKNTFTFKDRAVFTLTETNSGFYQRANFIHNQLELESFYLPIEIVFGSGTKGQSYLGWEDDQLFQLQTSYFTPADRWANSPGLENLRAKRPVVARCMECHSTFAKNTGINKSGNRYDRNNIIYGIDCERCHGPAAKHVGYQQKNPKVKTAKYILKYQELSRQQRLDACALCHSGGNRAAIKPPFSFLVGDELNKFYHPHQEDNNVTLDVHGNQYGLLTSSACFKNSPKMDCTTCHNPHENERGKSKNFNLKCISCHSQSNNSCKNEHQQTDTSMTDCIACHMPLVPSKSMVIQIDSVKTAVKVRTHNIAIY